MAKRQKRAGKRAYLKKSWRGLDPTRAAEYLGRSTGKYFGAIPESKMLSVERAEALFKAKTEDAVLWQSGFWQGKEHYNKVIMGDGPRIKVWMYFSAHEAFFIKHTIRDKCLERSIVYKPTGMLTARERAKDVFYQNKITYVDRRFDQQLEGLQSPQLDASLAPAVALPSTS